MLNETDEIIGVFQLLNKKVGCFGEEDEEFLGALSVHAALAVEKAQAFAEAVAKKAIEDELAVASEIQQRLLPTHLPLVEGYDFAVSNLPSEWVGGDYYDLVQLSDSKLSFIIADVCGKGIPASLLMATLRAALHSQTLSHGMSSPDVLISRLNRLVYNSTPASKFITAFYGDLDSKNGLVRYVNAGHNPPFHMLRNGEHNQLRVGGITLGLVEETNFVIGQITIGKGEMIVLYTDGVTEAMNPDGDEFGEERLVDVLKRNKKLPPSKLIEIIQHNL